MVSESGSKMSVFVELRFDGFIVNVSSVPTLTSPATLLLHNPPSVTVPSQLIAFYPNISQIVELRVRAAVIANATMTALKLTRFLPNHSTKR